MDYILESAMMLSEGAVPVQLFKDDNGYYFNVFNSKYGYYTGDEVLGKLQDLGATFKKETNYKQMKAIASKNGNVWLRVDGDKLSRTRDSKGALAGKKLSEGLFLAYENADKFFEGVYDAVSYETPNATITVADTLEGGSIVSITENDGNVVEMMYSDHDSAMDEALNFVEASSSIQESTLFELSEKVTGSQMRALFAKGFLKKNSKGKLKYSKTAFKTGRPKGKGDSKPRAKKGTSPNYERNKAYRERRKKIKSQNEGFNDLIQLKGNEYEANNQGSEDRYGRRIIGVKPIVNRRTESTEASAIKGKVAGSTRPIAKKRDLNK